MEVVRSNFLVFILFQLVFISQIECWEKFRAFNLKYVKEAPTFMLRCPLGTSKDDKIQLFKVQDEKSIEVDNYQNIKDSFVIDTGSISGNTNFKCINNRTDGKSEEMMIYVYDDNRFKDIRNLIYSIRTTKTLSSKVGESISVSCDEVESDVIWFNPELQQLNFTGSVLKFNGIKSEDFGYYFCGNVSKLVNGNLNVQKIGILSPNIQYDINVVTASSSASRYFPSFVLGQPVVYEPTQVAHTVTRRVIWHQNTDDKQWIVPLNQGRTYYLPFLPPKITEKEYYIRITDRSDITFQEAYMTLFQADFQSRKSFVVSIIPSSQNNVIENKAVTFSCSNSDRLPMTWQFQSTKSNIKQSLPNGVKILEGKDNSTIRINSAQFYHSGTYFCDAKKSTASATLKVNSIPKLVATPAEIIVRPGGKATFLCQLIGGQRGKVIWQRRDLDSFRMDVETMIGGDTSSMLVISNAPSDLNGTKYQCYHNTQSAESMLIVKDLCPTGYRHCNNGKCLPSQSFCNKVNDCGDNSDESLETCAHCEPNQRACQIHNLISPRQQCVAANWFCDGENDCGNGFDELNCPKIDRDACLSSHYGCKDNTTFIPRILWCDKTNNCPNGEDEQNCRDPSIIDPSRETSYVVQSGNRISLVCEVASVPTATITWRYNWGRLPSGLNYTITTTGRNCTNIRSVLTITSIDDKYAGVYTCEAVANRRTMAPDYTIFVTSEQLCKKPKFNNAAWSTEMCLKCWCSNITTDCVSATAHYQSPVPKSMKFTKAGLNNYRSVKTLEASPNQNFFNPLTNSYIFEGDVFNKVVIMPELFIGSDFGLSGSWLSSYGHYLKVSIKVTGSQEENIPGPVLVLQSQSGGNLYWCMLGIRGSQIIFATKPEGYTNNIRASLWERDLWYSDPDCQQPIRDRNQFMQSLVNINRILIRIKHYTKQTAMELRNISLDYTLQLSGNDDWMKDVWSPRTEQCKCPWPYSGLSCEKCVAGYHKPSLRVNKCVRKCPMNCLECSSSSGGQCTKCKGERSGPQCLQCKPGYFRLNRADLNSDCVKCPCQEKAKSILISNECHHDLKGSGNILCKCNGMEVNNKECDKCLQIPLDTKLKQQCSHAKNKTQENSNCNMHGTEKITDNQCRCNSGYEGEHCDTCTQGYFKHESRCLLCFCSNTTQQCTSSSSSKYQFMQITLQSTNTARIESIKLGNRQLSGLYRYPEIQQNKYLSINRSDNSFTVNGTPNEGGIIYVIIKLSDMINKQNIHTYTMLYGGTLKFNFQYILRNLNQLLYADVAPFIEIESSKYGRMWVPMTYNTNTMQMEVKFSEFNYPSWTSSISNEITREDIIRALMTTQYILIGFPVQNYNNQLEKIHFSQVSLDWATDSTVPTRTGPAPVEICMCPGRLSKDIKCAGCHKPGYQSLLSVTPGYPDFKCGQCIPNTASCTTCNSADYKYDFLLNKNYTSCQKGIEMSTKGRIIYANEGESIRVPCRVVSYKGGVALHTWTRSDNGHVKTERKYMNPSESQIDLIITNINQTHSGEYRCSALNALSNTSEEFLIIVKDQTPRLKVDIFVTTIDPDKPSFKVNISSSNQDRNATLQSRDYKVRFQIIRDSSDGSVGSVEQTESIIETSVTSRVVKDEDGTYRVEVSVPSSYNITGGMKLQVLITGDRVSQPYQKEIQKTIQRNVTVDPSSLKVRPDKMILKLKLLDSGRIRVLVDPELRTVVFWKRLLFNGTEIDLPQGISRQGNSLIVWSAGSNHAGQYVGYVVNVGDGGTKVGKVHVNIEVEEMIQPPPVVDIDSGAIKHNETSSVVDIYVPNTKYCPRQKWELYDPLTNTTTDVTNYVQRQSDRRILINYKIGVGNVIRLRCLIIQKAGCEGKIQVTFDSKDPVGIIKTEFTNTSLFPVTMKCTDGNHLYTSNITWFFNGEPISEPFSSQIEQSGAIINWTLVGGFSPQLHEGIYTCQISNEYRTKLINISVPDENNPNINKSGLPTYIKIISPTFPVTGSKGNSSVQVPIGQKIELTAIVHGHLNENSTIKWTITDPTSNRTQQIIVIGRGGGNGRWGKYYSTIVIASENNTRIGQWIYVVSTTLSNGTTIRQMVKVDSVDNSMGYMIQIDGLSDKNSLSVLEGGQESIRCSLVDAKTKKEVTNKAEINWILMDKYGRVMTLKDVKELETPSLKSGQLNVVLALRKLNDYRGQCKVKYLGKIYKSQLFIFDINQRNINPKVRLKGLFEDKYVVNREGSTSQVTCEGYDSSTNALLPSAKYYWDVTIDKEKNLQQSWSQISKLNNVVVFGGLKYYPIVQSSIVRCRVEYFGRVLESDIFRFNITKRKDKFIYWPEIDLSVIYDPSRPPYPVKVICRDSNNESSANSTITLTLPNTNFPRSIIKTNETGLLVIDFTADPSTNGFHPFYHSGLYNFKITNQYGSITKQVLLPQFNNTNDKYQSHLSIFMMTNDSRLQQVTNDTIRIRRGVSVKLICAYYGHPYPVEIKWSYQNMPNSKLSNGELTESHDYWVSLDIKSFLLNRHSRSYECRTSTTPQGHKSKIVTLQGFDYGILVNIVDENGNVIKGGTMNLKQGSDLTIKYKATNLMTGQSYKGDSQSIRWEIRVGENGNYTTITTKSTDGVLTPKSVSISGDTLSFTDLAETGKVSIRCTVKSKDTDGQEKTYISEPVTIDVESNESLYPDIRISTYYKNDTAYPTKLVCHDLQTRDVSKVKLQRADFINTTEIIKANVSMSHNKAEIQWNGYPFTPYYDQGEYMCTAKNRYGTNSLSIKLPQFSGKGTSKRLYVEFSSKVNKIEKKGIRKEIEVLEGDKFKITCNYFGVFSPVTPVEIIHRTDEGMARSSVDQPRSGRNNDIGNTFAHVTVENFNITHHSGEYSCRARTKDGLMTDYVKVMGIVPGIKVNVANLDDEDKLKLLLGDKKTIQCVATDRVTKKIRNDVEYSWEVYTNDGRVLKIRQLAENTKNSPTNGELVLDSIVINEIRKGRCVVKTKDPAGSKIYYYSKYFTISTEENESMKPQLTFTEIRNKQGSFPKSLKCEVNRGASEDISMKMIGGEMPKDVNVVTVKQRVVATFPELSTIVNPRRFEGQYECKATNKYGSTTRRLRVEYIKPVIPLQVQISSSANSQVSLTNDASQGEVAVGQRIEIDCIYKSDNQPISAQWFYRNNTNNSIWTPLSYSPSDTSDGFYIYQKRSDCLSVVRKSFDTSAKVMLRCQASDNISTINSANLDLAVVLVGVRVSVDGLDQATKPQMTAKQGSTKMLNCSVNDLRTGKNLNNNYTIKWKFYIEDKTTGIRYREISYIDLSQKGTVSNEQELKLESISKFQLNDSMALYGECVVSNSTHNYTSTAFVVQIKEDELRKPIVHFNKEFKGNRHNFPNSLRCVDNRDNKSNVEIRQVTNNGKFIEKSWIKNTPGQSDLIFKESNELLLPLYEGIYECLASNKFGEDKLTLNVGYQTPLSVVLNSTVHKIYTSSLDNGIEVRHTGVRKNRKLQFDCYVEGEQTPEVDIFLILEAYNPDIFVPGVLINLSKRPGGLYNAKQISKNHYRITREFFSSITPIKFQCNATLNNVTKSSAVNVYETKEIFKVYLITNSTQKLQPKAFTGREFKMGCEMRNYTSDKPVPIMKLDWEFKNAENGEIISIDKLGKSVDKDLKYIKIDAMNSDQGRFIEAKCIAYYNGTYDVYSETFTINIKDYPEIKSVYFKQISSPESSKIINKTNIIPYNYTYNASKDFKIECIANISVQNIETKIYWYKCDANDVCKSESSFASLILNKDSTTYLDVGHYKCVVEISFDGKSEQMNSSLFLDRKSAPRAMSNNKLMQKSTRNMNLACDNKYASPAGNVTWTFTPVSSDTPQALPSKAMVSQDNRRKSMSIQKPLELAFAGTYKCVIVNEYGQGGVSYTVVIKDNYIY